jgi:hypothetical protein
MANRFVSPQQQFINFAGQPYAGGFLYFYISGTSTPTPTYQDEALTTPNSNPVQLDSAGDAGNIFLDPGIIYKVVLTDSSLNPVWTFDPVIPIDSATGSGFTPIVSCNASGTNSITLTPITPSQQPALYSNYQVFAFVPVSTSTGPVSAQVGTLPSESVYVAPGVQAGSGTLVADDGPYYIAYGSLVGGSGPGFLLLNQNLGAIQNSLPVSPPQGYLTLTSQTPVIPSDVVGSTNVFYTPLLGLGAPVHNGVSIVSTLLPGELSLALTSTQAANDIYDIYLAYNGGSPVIGTGPSWAAGTGGSVTAGSCARGTGAGGAALVRTQGIWTNAAAMTLTYNLGAGNTALSIPANQGIYLGSISVDSTAGQVSAYRSVGQSRKFGIWNAYNRQPITLLVSDPTASWNYGSATLNPSNSNTNNSMMAFTGLPEELTTCVFTQKVSPMNVTGSTGFSANVAIGIGWNSTSAVSGQLGVEFFTFTGSSSSFSLITTLTANYVNPPGIGTNLVTALESGNSGPNNTFYGGAGMQLQAAWRG